MRTENLVLSVICGSALVLAAWFSWRWRKLPVLALDRPKPATGREGAARGLRTVASVEAAGLIAGFLVAGLGGRLMMRLMAATSGDGAQRRLTEAEERVGEITLGGTIGFVLFGGLLLGAAAGLVYLLFRRFLPDRAWSAGIVFGLLLLATFGVGDPLSPDNIDFAILKPLPLAVAFISGLALLFGTTFAALAAHFESSTRLLGVEREAKSTGGRTPYPFLIFLLPVPPMLAVVGLYVVGCAIAKGRVATALDHPRVHDVAFAIGVIAAALALWKVGVTAAEIV